LNLPSNWQTLPQYPSCPSNSNSPPKRVLFALKIQKNAYFGYKKSVNNGFTKEQHFAVVSDIDNLFRNSVKVLTHPDKSKDPNVKAMHRFAASLFGNNIAYITVKEATEQGKRIYTVELIEMGKLEGFLNEVKSKSLASNPATSFPY
jgi:hypothetical protein